MVSEFELLSEIEDELWKMGFKDGSRNLSSGLLEAAEMLNEFNRTNAKVS